MQAHTPVKDLERIINGGLDRALRDTEAAGDGDTYETRTARAMLAAPALLAALEDAQLKLTGAEAWITEVIDLTEGVTVDYDGSGETDQIGLLEDINNSRERALAALAETLGSDTAAN